MDIHWYVFDASLRGQFNLRCVHVCAENNKDSKPGEIDLHGLYVKEAIMYTDRAIQEAKQRGDSEIQLIVGACPRPAPLMRIRVNFSLIEPGKGLHSRGGVAKLKPAIEELIQKCVPFSPAQHSLD